MTLSIWRYSHLLLAISTAIFVFIASVTGIILAFEPISNQLHSYAIEDAKDMSIAQLIPNLSANYSEIYSIEVDENGFLKASVIDRSGTGGEFYINPKTGEKLGNLIKKKPIFEFATNLHRSLFLKSTGRLIIGFVSLLLTFIVITGILLIAKRQGGYKKWFSKVVKEDRDQYNHVILGRYAVIPILIITLTGVFLSLERFSLLPEVNVSHLTYDLDDTKTKVSSEEFEVFRSVKLKNLVSLEFPFSPDESDYYILKLNDEELNVHQYNGSVISKAEVPLMAKLFDWSLLLHTGKGSIIWSVLLGITCISVLYFMYSGFAMSLKRKRVSTTFKNSFTKDESEYIVLTGSETGNTFRFASQFAEALISASKSVFIDSLNNYSNYPKAKQLLVFTSTYGEGDAPSSASNFMSKLNTVEQNNLLEYAVVGFGSLLYPDYCKYAIDVDKHLQNHNKFIPKLPLFKINNQSFQAFKNWVQQWNKVNNANIIVKPSQPIVSPKSLKAFEVVNKSALSSDNTFTIQLKPKQKTTFTSGDLLAVYPRLDEAERLYSIGKMDDLITLSIKRHEMGLASNTIFGLKQGDKLKARVKHNPHFHLSQHYKEIILIANGTGIAPFLGMINQSNSAQKVHLFWGGRNQESLSLYNKFIDNAFSKNNLTSFHLAFSQQNNRQYVQDLIKEHSELIGGVLKHDGLIMICGSISMQNMILERLDEITRLELKRPLSDFESNDQIKMDCY